MTDNRPESATDEQIAFLIEERLKANATGEQWPKICDRFRKKFKSNRPDSAIIKMHSRYSSRVDYQDINKPELKILLLDIETAPILGYVWGLFDQNVGLNQIKKDWHVLSWAAKWLHDSPKNIMYNDQRNAKNIEDDSKILKEIWHLIDEADILISQNGKSFDIKKLNARFIQHGFPPPSSYRHIDTKILAKRHFAFTSNKLEYMTDKLCTKYKKLKHSKFSGFELWRECLAGNVKAWNEMKKYNMYDVLSLEELYLSMQPWDRSINFDVFHNKLENVCSCGSKKFTKRGFKFTNTGKFHRLICDKCGAEYTDKTNLLSKQKKVSLLK
jgi:DNA polymerase elongation subunit (family B)